VQELWAVAAAARVRFFCWTRLSGPARSGAAGFIPAVLLSLALLGGWPGSALAVTCATAVPCKEIWFFNNSNETLYPVLFTGRRGVDEWMQAYSQTSAAQRNATPPVAWPTTRDSRVYINGKIGIAPKDTTHPGYAKIQMPLFTALLPFSDVATGTRPDSQIDWWNGGRLEIFDTAATIGTQYDLDVAQKAPYGVIDPTELNKNIVGNAYVSCVEGDCSNLKMVAVNFEFDNSAPFQLTEFTFGSAQTGALFATKPYGWVPSDVGYNLSMVDSTYLPAAMEPLNNSVIPYIGSVMAPSDFRLRMQQWLKDHDGYPIYKSSTTAQPKIPQSFDVFANAFFQFTDTYNGSNNLNFNPNGTAADPGKPIKDMIGLYLKCKDQSTAGPTTTCGKIYNLEHTLFGPNLAKYLTYPCAVYENPPGSGKTQAFPDTIAWRLWTLYGWVPYNFQFVASKPCGNADSIPPFTGNALFDTVGKTVYQQLADTYRIDNNGVDPNGLQYNYQTESDKTQWFNPYVELLHSSKYLAMRTYAFSIDDAVGFQQHKGEGLIYAVGGTNGLQNTNLLDPNAIVNVTFGQATDGSTYLWQASQYACKDGVNHVVNFTDFPSYDFFPLNSGGYPCRVGALLSNNVIYYFDIPQGPPNLKIDCSAVTDATIKDWCTRIAVIALPQTPLNLDHIIGPAVAKK